MMLSTMATSPPVHSPRKKGGKAGLASPAIKQEPGTSSKGKKLKKNPVDGESLQQLLIRANGEFVEPMQIVLASPAKQQASTTAYSPIAPATHRKANGTESGAGWMTTNMSQTTKNAQALALKAVARNQVAKINLQQQQQQQQLIMDTGEYLLASVKP